MAIVCVVTTCLFIFAGTGAFLLSSKVPLADSNVKGWLYLKQTSFGDEVDVTFNLTISANVSLPLHAEWFISDIPVIYGDEACALIGSEKYTHSKLANFSVKSHNVLESALVKGVSLLDIVDRALVLKFNQTTEACSNILLNDTKIFRAQFYGPELGGTTYYFLHESLMLLKIYSLILNANNFDLNLKWSLRKYWWLPRQDSREPSVALCREKSKNAYYWYQPPFDNQTEPKYLKPETRQLITVTNCSLSRENLARSVLVVDKISSFSWDAKKSSCAKLSAVDDSAQSETCSADGEILLLQQASPFHPLRAFHSRSACASPEPLPMRLLAESGETSLLLHTALPAFATNLRFAHSNVALVRFFFPFAGELRLEQSQNDSDSFTLVSGSLISLFDESDDVPIAGRLQLLKGATPATLNDMSCLVSRDVYNPAAIDDVFCQKSQALCAVGRLPYSVRVAVYNGWVELVLRFHLTNSHFRHRGGQAGLQVRGQEPAPGRAVLCRGPEPEGVRAERGGVRQREPAEPQEQPARAARLQGGRQQNERLRRACLLHRGRHLRPLRLGRRSTLPAPRLRRYRLRCKPLGIRRNVSNRCDSHFRRSTSRTCRTPFPCRARVYFSQMLQR